MLLEGANIENQNAKSAQNVLSICQLIIYNLIKRSRTSTSGNVRHTSAQNTPLPIYLALLLHAKTRKRELVDNFFQLGLCISYDRMLSTSAALANTIISCFDMTPGPCPPGLFVGVFTTAAVDNIDHNPSSTTASDSFHGTAISLTQHRTSE